MAKKETYIYISFFFSAWHFIIFDRDLDLKSWNIGYTCFIEIYQIIVTNNNNNKTNI